MPERPHAYEGRCAAIREVLLHEWDPIGIAEEPCARDEYDSYVPGIAWLIDRGADSFRLAEHLYQIETIHMGLRGRRDECHRVAGRLLSLGCA